MIVDDHAETRALIRELIGHYVDEIRECANGEEAATQCAEFRPDLVTMDLNMPLTGGLEATRRILEHHPETRVIVITQTDTAENRKAAVHAGACHFFSKNNLIALLAYVRQQMRILTASKTLSQ
jgi:two-component system, chemotaxis family, chemotaxis protein CheY